MQAGRFNVVMGAQAGSEAKGKVSAYLADKHGVKVFVMTASPNAGHTVIKDGNKYVTHHIPCGAFGSKEKPVILLTPGSVINPTILLEEIKKFGKYLGWIWIDPRAAIITPKHQVQEKEKLRLGNSTGQGVGEARKQKLDRVDVTRAIDIPELHTMVSSINPILLDFLDRGETVIAESTQGFDLCLEHGADPQYCTTRLISPQAELAYAGVPCDYLGDVYGVLRPYPIRINNSEGTSGPYPGAREMTWEEVTRLSGSPSDLTEITTTTKRVRRVFSFSDYRWLAFCRICRPTHLALNFANYLDWDCYQYSGTMTVNNIYKTWKRIGSAIRKLDRVSLGAKVSLIGTGPNHEDIVEVADDD